MDELGALLEIRRYLEILTQYATFLLYFILPCVLIGLLCWWFWRTFMRW